MTRVRLGPVKDSSGNLCMESEEIGEAMNEYFSSVFTKERSHVFEDESMLQADRLEVDVLREDVLAILKNLKVDKSPGLDGIYPRILWEARDEIAEPLALIFGSSLSTGIVSEDWRVANVVPLL